MTRALTLALTLTLALISVAFIAGSPSTGTAGAWQRLSPEDDLATRIAEPRGTEESRAPDDAGPGGGSAESGSLVDLAESLLETEPDFGPVNGELEIADDAPGFHDLPGLYDDFLLSVTFLNAGRDWYDFGVMFRLGGSFTDPSMITFGIDPSGFWLLVEGTLSDFESNTVTILESGFYGDLDQSRTSENTLSVLAQGDQVLVMINGEELATVAVSYEDAGMISILGGLSTGGDGDILEFTDLMLWELD